MDNKWPACFCATTRKKDGKEHRYWSIVENKRFGDGRVMQRHVLYLGEINASQELGWRKSIEVFEDGGETPCTLALFPEDCCEGRAGRSGGAAQAQRVAVVPATAMGWLLVGAQLWQALRLDEFWAARLLPSRKGTRWDQVLFVLVAYRLLAPGSEWRLHRQWFERSALPICSAQMRGSPISHPLSMSRPVDRAQTRGVRSPDKSMARSLQRLV